MSKKYLCLILFSFLSLYLLESPTFAAKKDTNSLKLPQIVITATRTPINATSAPAYVNIITSKDMKYKDISTIDDALTNEPGIIVIRRKGIMDSVASVTLRGLPYQQRTLVLLDGVPLNGGYAGVVKWADLSTSDVSRIEVIQGPSSALWGGNAMGGVINIITATPKKFFFSATGGLGSYNTKRGIINVGDKLGLFSFLVGYEEERTDGYVTTPVIRTPGTTTGTPVLYGGYSTTDKTGDELKWVVGDKGNNGGKRWNYHMKGVFDFGSAGKLSLSYQTGVLRYFYGHPHTYLTDANGNKSYNGYVYLPNGETVHVTPYYYISYAGISTDRTDICSANYKVNVGKVATKFVLAYLHRSGFWTKPNYGGDYDSATGQRDNTYSETYYADGQASFPIFSNQLITTGLSLRKDWANVATYDIPFYRDPDPTGDKTYAAQGSSFNLGLFVQDQVELLNNLDMYLGIRYDHWWTYHGASGTPGAEQDYPSRDKGAFSPKLAFVYKPLKYTTIRTSVGKAFRAPNIYELYRTWQYYSTTYEGNPDLDPETIWNAEIGVSQGLLNNKINVKFTYYHSWLHDLIYSKTISTSTGTVKEKINAGNADIDGFESALIIRPIKNLYFEINYTRLDTKMTDNPADPASEGKRLINCPPWIWNFIVKGKTPRFYYIPSIRLAFFGQYIGKMYTEDDNSDVANVYGTFEKHFIANVKASIKPVKWAEISFSVRNLFDKHYYSYYIAPDRTYMTTVTLEF